MGWQDEALHQRGTYRMGLEANLQGSLLPAGAFSHGRDRWQAFRGLCEGTILTCCRSFRRNMCVGAEAALCGTVCRKMRVGAPPGPQGKPGG